MLATPAQRLDAQWRGEYLSARLIPARGEGAAASVTPAGTGRLVAGGALGAVAGAGLALLTYSILDRQDPCLASDCDSRLGTGLLAATAGVTAMIPLGVHLANRRHGSLLTDLLVSAGVAGLGWGGAALADDGRWLLLIPPAQIAAAVLAERATTR